MEPLVVKLAPRIGGCDCEKIHEITTLLNWHADEMERLFKELDKELAKAELRLVPVFAQGKRR